MGYFIKSDFELFEEFGGKAACDCPDYAHHKLRAMYDKLGNLVSRLTVAISPKSLANYSLQSIPAIAAQKGE